MEQGRSLVHPLGGIGRRRNLWADGRKNEGGCTVDNGETFGQQAGISVIELAVGKCGLALQSERFADYNSRGFGFLLMQGAGHERPALDGIKQLAGYLSEQH